MVGWLGFNRTFSTKLLKWSGGAGCPFPKNPIPTKAIRSSVLGPLSFVIACLPKSLYQNTPVSKVRNILQRLLHFRLQHIRTFVVPHFCIIVSSMHEGLKLPPKICTFYCPLAKKNCNESQSDEVNDVGSIAVWSGGMDFEEIGQKQNRSF